MTEENIPEWNIDQDDPSRATEEDKIRFLGELRGIVKERDYRPEWANHKFREVFGQWPSEVFNGTRIKTLTPSEGTLAWVSRRVAEYAAKRHALVTDYECALERLHTMPLCEDMRALAELALKQIDRPGDFFMEDVIALMRLERDG
jgi:hypothetical protein